MKKKIVYILVGIIVILLIKYYTGDYVITYNVGEYKVKEVSEDNNIYLEVIDSEGYTYNYYKYEDRSFSKKSVSSIKSDGDCLFPSGFYYVCKGEESLELKDSGIDYVKYKDDFKYNGKLNNNEYVLIWKYDGFYYLNGSEYKTINIFKKDRYSNDLMYLFDKYLVFPNYSDEYMFDGFIVLDITTSKYKEYSINSSISYESEYVGVHKNNLYLFDKKNNNLIELNIKNGKSKVVGDSFNGYFKYEGNKKVSVKLSDYLSSKVKFFKNSEDVTLVKDNYLSYKYNDKVKLKYFSEDVSVVGSINGKVYFIYKDNLYSYSMGKISEIAHYFELTFNSNNKVFSYID